MNPTLIDWFMFLVLLLLVGLVIGIYQIRNNTETTNEILTEIRDRLDKLDKGQ